MKNRKYDKEFKLDCLKYCAEHKELTQVAAAKNLGVSGKTLSRWIGESRRNEENAFRGSGNRSSDLEKENARLRCELRNANDALEILKKAVTKLKTWHRTWKTVTRN